MERGPLGLTGMEFPRHVQQREDEQHVRRPAGQSRWARVAAAWGDLGDSAAS